MQKSFVLLIGATVLAVGAAFLTQREGADAVETELGPLLPGVNALEDRIASLRIAAGGETATLERTDDGWVSVDLNGYPAELEQVAAVVRGLADLEKIEAKTMRADRHERLGLADPGAEGSSAVLVEALDAGGQRLAGVVLGERFYDLPGEHRFARLPDEDQTWLVSGSVPTQTAPMTWVDAVALGLGGDSVARVARIEDGQEVFAVVRPDASSFEWSLESVPEGMKEDSGGRAGRLGRLLASLRFDQVRALSDVELPDAPAHELLVQTFEGLRVTVRAYRVDQIEGGEAPAEPSESGEPLWLTLSMSAPDPMPEDPAAAAAVGEQLAEYVDRLGRWIYRVDSFTGGGIAATLGQMILDATPEDEPFFPENPEIGPPAPGTAEAEAQGEGASTDDDGTDADG